jgi:hypothetical protein
MKAAAGEASSSANTLRSVDDNAVLDSMLCFGRKRERVGETRRFGEEI